MPDRELIHASTDVALALRAAAGLGLEVITDEPQVAQQPGFVRPDGFEDLSAGQFHLVHPAWISGALEMSQIHDGVNSGKYFLKPRVNFDSIYLFMLGERRESEQRLLGSGGISYKAVSKHESRHVATPAAPSVAHVFKQLIQEILPGASVKAGVHTYHLCPKALEAALARDALPPYDFISWSAIRMARAH